MSGSAWKRSRQHRRLARALAREAVTEVAAGELPLFEQRARSHFRPRLWSRRPLSLDVFGLAAEVVTPAALSAAADITPITPAAAELARWRTAALSGALRHVSEQRAQQVADSVLAELVQMLATDAAPEPPTVLQSSGASGAGGPHADDADRQADGARGSGDTEHTAGHGDPDGDGPAATRL